MSTEKSKMDSFASAPIQAVFDFLCEQFGVVGDQYDQWIEENAVCNFFFWKRLSVRAVLGGG